MPLKRRLMLGDCLKRFSDIEDQSIDMVLCDPPYGTTQCKWDSIIPLEPMWSELKRVVKPSSAMVFTAAQPFTSTLVLSQPKLFRYTWVWNKVNRITGFLDAKKKPLKVTEDVVVFYSRQPVYNPQMVDGKPYTATSRGAKSQNYAKQADGITTISDGKRYPQNLLSIKGDERGTVGRIHSTQKPVALMEYLIKTYTNPGDTVLDFAMGSGTTGVAAKRLQRNFIGIEKDRHFFQIAKQRIRTEGEQDASS